MATTPILPRAQSALSGGGPPSTEWFDFFRNLLLFAQENIDNPAVIADILARLDELEAHEGDTFAIQGLFSVRVSGTPAGGIVQLYLDGDVDDPGNTFYYGTGPTGEKTWFAVADAVAGADSVIQSVGLDGVSTFNLDGDVLAPGNLFGYGTNMAGAKGWYRPALFESTGVLDGGTLSINGADNTKFDIALSIIGQSDYSVNPASPERTVISFGPSIGVTVANLAIIATYVGIQMPGGTVTQQSSPFTAAQTRFIAPLGAVISNGVNLIAVNNLPNVMRAGINQVQDLMTAIGPMNLSGNVISPNGAGLDMNKSAGVVFKQGSNFTNDEDNPHGLALPALTGFSFNYRLSTGTQFASTTVVDPSNYESPLGTLTAVPAANRFTIQRFTVFTSNLIRAQYGQNVYNTMADAEAALSTEAFATETNIAENGILLCFLIVEDGATDLSDPGQAKFIPASKFGAPVGSGGTSITNTDALPEGLVNLYFTAARVLATVLSGLSTATSAVITAADTVLSALGKLQAQITVIAPGPPSGTYTPTLFNGANISGSVASVWQWMRVGNTVTASGRLDISTTVAGGTLSTIGMSLPVASNFATPANLAGAGGMGYTPYVTALVIGDSVNDRASVNFHSPNTAATAGLFTFTYTVI